MSHPAWLRRTTDAPAFGWSPSRAARPRNGRVRDQESVLELQQLAGNAAVAGLLAQRAVVSREAPPVAAGPPAAGVDVEYQSLPAPVQAVVDEDRYRTLVADPTDGPGVRVTLVGAYRMLSRLGNLWGLIDEVKWVGTGGMNVWVSPSAEAFKRRLEAEGFESSWFARRGADLWGLRKTVEGVGLHIRGKSADVVEIHFDLSPPRWWALFGLWHKIQDDWRRGKTVTPATLRKALRLEAEL